MSVQVNTAFVQQYSTNIMMLLQQQGSRLRNAVQNYSFQGKAASMAEQFGSVTPVRNRGVTSGQTQSGEVQLHTNGDELVQRIALVGGISDHDLRRFL